MDGRSLTLHGSSPSLLPQYLTTLIVTLGSFTTGCVIGYSSPAGPQLMSNSTSNSTHSALHISSVQNDWFGSTVNVGAAVGGLICGFSLSHIGRKKTMQASAIPFIGAWLILAFSTNFAMLMVGRILTGFCSGITTVALPTYIGEYASANCRGTLGASFQFMVTVGVFYAMAVGAFVSWDMLAGLCAIPACLYFAFLFFIKESPVYLLSKGKEEEAVTSLQYFRGKHYNIQPELDMMRQSVEESQRKQSSLKDLLKPHNLKPLLISSALMFFQQFSGINPVIFNLATIFQDAGSTLSAAYSSIIIGVVQVGSTFLAVVLADKAGRKILLITSSTLMALSLVALGEFFYFKNEDEEWAVSTLGWLPLVSLILFILAFSVGFGPIPWLMMGELFASDVKETAASVATLLNWTCSFIVTLIFLPLQQSIGDYGVYWLFSAICILNLIFCVCFVPETKGKTLEEISAYFGGSSSEASTRRKTEETSTRRTTEDQRSFH